MQCVSHQHDLTREGGHGGRHLVLRHRGYRQAGRRTEEGEGVQDNGWRGGGGERGRGNVCLIFFQLSGPRKFMEV